MEKMEFIYTSGWEKFEQYCKELYRGYLNRYCQGKMYLDIRYIQDFPIRN